MTFTLYLSLGLLATSFAFLIQSIIIFYIEEKLTKITVNHHGRIKNLEERIKKLEENFENIPSFENISSFENIPTAIGRICVSNKKSENFFKKQYAKPHRAPTRRIIR